MADYGHLTNIIQGEVIRITERRPPEQQPADLEELIIYLRGQAIAVAVTKLKINDELAEELITECEKDTT